MKYRLCEECRLGGVPSDGMCIGCTIKALQRENDKLRAALEEIKAMRGMTLLGPDSKHHMGDDAPCYHEMGAAAAFEQCAEIAESALLGEEAK